MNDERPIEKLLRRFAKKRRDEAGAPAELHAANRRALQAEVARQFPRAQDRTGSWAGLSLLLNRKLAYAVAIVAVVGISALLIRPPKHEPMGLAALDAKKTAEKQLPYTSADGANTPPMTASIAAKDSFATDPTVAAAPPVVRTESLTLAADSAITASEVNSTPPQPAPFSLAPVTRTRVSPAANVEADRAASRRQQVAESVARYDEQSAGRAPARSDALLTAAPAESAPIAAAPKLPTTGSTATDAEAQLAFSRRYGAGSPTSAAASASPATTGLASSAKAELAKSVQNFSQVSLGNQSRPGRTPSGTVPVLVNFVVEQAGEQIRMTDSDGSTYTGFVQFAAQENLAQKEFLARGGGLEKSRQATYDAALNEARPAGAQNYLFRVVGTNRTLNQPVNFVGNFVTLSNQMSGAFSSAQFADKAKNAPTQQQVLPVLQNSAIQGRLQIGSGREVELNAVPVKP